MKILFITAEGFDTPNPNNQMAEVMINDFLNAGHRVHLVQSHRKGINDDIPASLRRRSGFTVDTILRKVIDKSNFISRYIDDVRYHFHSLRYYKRVKDADVIYLQSNPTIYFPMIFIKLFLRKIPIVYSIYDVFPGHAYDIGVIRNKLLYELFRLMQKPCYKWASAIVVLSEDMKDMVVKEGARVNDVYIAPAWFDVNSAREVPVNENQFIKKYGIDKSKFIVQYAGSIGYVFNYKTVIELAKRLKDDTDIVLQMVGDGPAKDVFIQEAKENNLNNIEFYPLQPIPLVPDVYSTCDVCIIPLKKGVIGNGTPSKAPILMACRRIIVNAVESWSKYSQMFEKFNMGYAVDVYDYDALANVIHLIKDDPEDTTIKVANAYEYGKEHFSSTRSTAILMDVLARYARS
jgi:colanic acid biosynthesis glycosyl transferase WcaI